MGLLVRGKPVCIRVLIVEFQLELQLLVVLRAEMLSGSGGQNVNPIVVTIM